MKIPVLKIVTSRILENGICARSGCLRLSDEIVRFNGRNVAAASIESVRRPNFDIRIY